MNRADSSYVHRVNIGSLPLGPRALWGQEEEWLRARRQRTFCFVSFCSTPSKRIRTTREPNLRIHPGTRGIIQNAVVKDCSVAQREFAFQWRSRESSKPHFRWHPALRPERPLQNYRLNHSGLLSRCPLRERKYRGPAG